MRLNHYVAAVAAVLISGLQCGAELAVPSIFSDHAMLQADVPASVWGTADPRSSVSVTFDGAEVHAQADASGRWILWLPSQSSGQRGDLTIASGAERRTLHDVLFGEVWFASGQSNMERSLHFSDDREKVGARAARSAFRFFVVQHAVRDEPAFDVEGHWEIANTTNIDRFSAAACSFAVELSERLKRPVGIVDSSFGGTRLMAWTSQATLDSDPRFKYVLDRWAKNLATLPGQEDAYRQALQKRIASLSPEDRAKVSSGAAVPGKPSEPMGRGSKMQPAGLYNGMVAPLTQFAVRGVLWYQGENDATDAANAYQYRFLFQAMIESWRRAFGDQTLPFLFVQLSRYHGQAYPLVRESQAKGLNLAHTAMVVSIDQGTKEDVHYPDKEVVGARLERAAEEVAYGERGAYVPLQPVKLTIEGNALRVWFSPAGVAPRMRVAAIPYFAPDSPEAESAPHVVDGRAILERQPTPEELQVAAQIAGPDGLFLPATMRIEGDSVVFTSSPIAHPTQVCYAWSDAAPAVLLWSADDLPVTPFRLAEDPAVEPACPSPDSSIRRSPPKR